MKLRKLVTKDWAHVFPGLVSGCGGGGKYGRPMKLDIRFWGIVIGRFNAEKWGDHKKKKFFINNFIEVVISFKQKHQSLLKHVLALSIQ